MRDSAYGHGFLFAFSWKSPVIFGVLRVGLTFGWFGDCLFLLRLLLILIDLLYCQSVVLRVLFIVRFLYFGRLSLLFLLNLTFLLLNFLKISKGLILLIFLLLSRLYLNEIRYNDNYDTKEDDTDRYPYYQL